MITKLNNFTLKSFVGYTNPNDLLFRAKNILFGYNGKGKSSIAIGIKDEFLKDPNKKPENLRIFDRDYISNSLLLENSEGKIKGVEASFGKGIVDIVVLTPQMTGHNLKNKLGLINFGDHDTTKKKIYT